MSGVQRGSLLCCCGKSWAKSCTHIPGIESGAMSWFYGKGARLRRLGSVADDVREWSSELEGEFNKWKAEHGVVFRDDEEERARKGFFKEKYEWTKHRNAELLTNGSSFQVGFNIMAALSPEEHASLTGNFVELDSTVAKAKAKSLRTPQNEPPFDRSLANSDGVGKLGQDGLPVSIDWRKIGGVTDVKSQGRCGACWAFAATGALEGLMYKNTGKLISLSEDQLLECDSHPFQKACNGGNFVYSLDFASTNAITTSALYPYSYTDGHRNTDPCRIGPDPGIFGVVRGNGDATVSDFKGVRFVPESEQELKAAVARQPIAAAISGYSRDFQTYKSGVFDSSKCGETVDHAVLIVGYGTTLPEEGQEDFWLIKNQWGIGWGDNGYMKLKRNTGLPKGLCGILKQLNYPTAASCSVGDCTPHRSSQFCRVSAINDSLVECVDASDISYEEEWFIPNSTYVWVDRPVTKIPVEAKDALVVVAVLLSFAILVLSFLIGHSEYKKRKHNRETALNGENGQPSSNAKNGEENNSSSSSSSSSSSVLVLKVQSASTRLVETLSESKSNASAKLISTKNNVAKNLKAFGSTTSVKLSAAKDQASFAFSKVKSSTTIKLESTKKTALLILEESSNKRKAHDLRKKDPKQVSTSTSEQDDKYDVCEQQRVNVRDLAANEHFETSLGQKQPVEERADQDAEQLRKQKTTGLTEQQQQRKPRRKSFASLDAHIEGRASELTEEELDRRLLLAREMSLEQRRNKSKKKSLRHSKRK